MADDYFLRIPGIEGESTDEKHKGEIEVLSWTWGETNAGSAGPGGGGGGGAGRVQMEDLQFTARVSKASPKLFLACAAGEHLQQAVLTARKAGGDRLEFLTYTLSDLLVTSYQSGASADTEVVRDSVSLNFSKIQIEYKEQSAKGGVGATIKAGWDVRANKKV